MLVKMNPFQLGNGAGAGGGFIQKEMSMKSRTRILADAPRWSTIY